MKIGPLRWLPTVALVVAMNAAACGSETTPTFDAPARAEIHPQSLLIAPTEAGTRLEVSLYTSEGVELAPGAVEWTSSDPTVVRVDADGTVHAAATRGSAMVTAVVDGIRTPPAFVLVAVPAPGAVLLDDAQVVRGPYDLTDEDAAMYRYGVTVREAAGVDVGDLVLSKGEAQVAGRVVSLASGAAAGEVDVVMELVPLDVLFDDLAIDVAVDESALAVPEAIEARYDVVRHDDGRVQLTARESGTSSASLTRRGLSVTIGPFECKTEDPIAVGFALAPSITIDPTIDFRLRYDSAQGGLQDIILDSALQVSAELQTQLTATLQAKVECTLEALVLTIPIGGPLALVFGGQVPLGAGFEATLAFPTTIGMKATLQAGYTSRIGLECTSGACEMVNDLDGSATGEVAPVIVVPDRINIEGFGFGYAKLALGTKLMKKLRFDFLVVKAGLKLDGKFAFTKEIQAEDPALASEYKILLSAVGELGKSFDDVLGFIKVTSTKVEAKIETVLDASPHGVLSVSPAQVDPGDTVTLRVELTDLDFLGTYNVEAVHIYRATQDAAGDLVLESVAQIPAGVEQAAFSATWVPDEEHVGTQSFYAYVDTVWIALPLEVAADSRREVVVGPGTIDACDPTSRVNARAPADLEPFRGLTRLEVPLYVGGDIADLSVLSSLEVAACNLEVEVPLTGLERLRRVDADLKVSSRTGRITTLAPLANLERVEGLLHITGSSFTSLAGLEALTSVGGLIIRSAPDLSSIAALSNLIELRNGPTTTSGTEGTLQVVGLPALTSLAGLEGLTDVPGSFGLSQTQVPSLLPLSNITRIGDDISIDANGALTTLAGLENIQTVLSTSTAVITIDGNDSLADISALGGVTGGAIDLRIERNPELTSLSGLQGLTRFGRITLNANARLSDVSALSGVTSLGILQIESSDALSDVSPLANAAGIRTLRIRSCPGLVDLSALSFPSDVFSIEIVQTPVTSVSGLSNIRSSVGVRLSETALTSLRDLGGLVSTWDFTITSNNALTSIDMDALTTVDGSFIMRLNPMLPQSDVNAFVADLTIGGTVTTDGNGR